MSDTKPRSPSDTSQVVAAWWESTAKDCWLHRAGYACTQQIPSDALVISNFNNYTSTYCGVRGRKESLMDTLLLSWPLPCYCCSKPIQLVTKGKLLKHNKNIYPKKSWDAWDATRPLQGYTSSRITAGACHGIQALSLHLASTTSSSISRNSWWQSFTLGRHERNLAS